MPIPAPILPEQLLYGHRVGVERATYRMVSAATTEVGLVLASGPKKLLRLNVWKTPLSDAGINATFDLELTSVSSIDTLPIFTGQAVPTSGNPASGVQLVPAAGTPAAENISANYPVVAFVLHNPDNDSMDLCFELVYVSPVSDENETISGDASIVKMEFV